MGEVMFRDHVAMKGYFRNPAATKKAFEGGWFHSGELGGQHPDGHIQLKARSKDIITSTGENISSVEVENVLCSHPSIEIKAVVAMPHENAPLLLDPAFRGARDRYSGIAGLVRRPTGCLQSSGTVYVNKHPTILCGARFRSSPCVNMQRDWKNSLEPARSHRRQASGMCRNAILTPVDEDTSRLSVKGVNRLTAEVQCAHDMRSATP